MMIKGVLFDKDGTLINFNKLWIKMVGEMVDELLVEVGEVGNQTLKCNMLESVGVANQSVDGKGYLASGTSLDVAEAFQKLLPEEIPGLHEWIKSKQSSFTANNLNLIEPTGDIAKLVSLFRNKNIVVGVVTADDLEATHHCLKKLDITGDIQFIATADLFEAKPSPESFQVFCEKFNLKPDEVVMVGDTVVDMQYAKNGHACYGIGVLSGTGSEEELAPLADFMISTIDDLIEQDDMFVWETNKLGKRGVNGGINQM